MKQGQIRMALQVRALICLFAMFCRLVGEKCTHCTHEKTHFSNCQTKVKVNSFYLLIPKTAFFRGYVGTSNLQFAAGFFLAEVDGSNGT